MHFSSEIHAKGLDRDDETNILPIDAKRVREDPAALQVTYKRG
jgi:hypothetical protein